MTFKKDTVIMLFGILYHNYYRQFFKYLYKKTLATILLLE